MMGYVYGPDGLRVGKGTISTWTCNPLTAGFAMTASYVLGPGGEQVSEMAVTGTYGNYSSSWQHTNVFANGSLLATYNGTETYFALSDWLGTKRAEITPDGQSTRFFELPYGNDLTSIGSLADATEQHFTGKERDAETGEANGNDYFGARYYASSMGRWLSPDPSGLSLAYPDDPQSFNLYSYVGNHPFAYIDPYGLNWFDQAPCGGAHYSVTSLGTAIKSFFANLFADCGGSSSEDADPYPFGPGGSGSTFQTGSGRQFNTSALGAIRTLQNSAHDLQKRKIRKSACVADLTDLGLTVPEWKGGAGMANFVNGVGSQVPFSSVAPGSNPALRPGTIGSQFAAHPGTTALAVLHGHTIYINPSLIDPSDYYGNLGLVGHEVIHNVTGNVDEVIQGDLGIAVNSNNTLNITQKLIKDCF